MQITCKEAIRCSRPVYFEVEENFEYSEEYPYYRHGSSFICKYRDRYFIVTAEHVIQDTDNPERLFVLSEKDDETILVPDRSIKINSNDEPFKDIRIFRIDDSIENDEWKVDAIPISERSVHIGSKATQHGSSLVLSGFPKSRGAVHRGSPPVAPCVPRRGPVRRRRPVSTGSSTDADSRGGGAAGRRRADPTDSRVGLHSWPRRAPA